MRKEITCTLLAFVICLVAEQSHSQNYSDTLIAYQNLIKGDSLNTLAKHNEAIPLFEKAAKIYFDNGLMRQYFESTLKLAKANLDIRNLQQLALQAQIVKDQSLRHFGEDNIHEANALSLLAIVDFYSGKFEMAFDKVENAIRIKESLYGKENISLFEEYNRLGAFNLAIGDFRRSIKNFKKALSINEVSYGKDYFGNSKVQSNLGGAYLQIGNYDSSMLYHQQVLTLRMQNLGSESYLVGESYANIGITLYSQGRYVQALEHLEKSVKIINDSDGPKDINLANSLNTISVIYNNFGKFDLAVLNSKKVLEIRQKLYGPTHPEVATTILNLGTLYSEAGSPQLALKNFRQSASIFKKIGLEQHPWYGSLQLSLAELLTSMGNLDSSMHAINTALKILRAVEGQVQNEANAYRLKGDVFIKKEQYDSAILYYEKCIDTMKSLGQETKDPMLAYYYLATGIAYRKSGDPATSISYLEKSLEENLSVYTADIDIDSISEKEVLDNLYFLSTLKEMALSLQALGQKENSSDRYLNALHHFQLCDALIDQLINQNPVLQDRLILIDNIREIYEKAVGLCLELSRFSQDKNYHSLAFYFVEKSKARLLSEAIVRRSSRAALLPDSLSLKEESLKLEISDLQTRLLAVNDQSSAEFKNIEGDILETKTQQELLAKQLQKEYPQYYETRYGKSFLSEEKIAQELEDRSAVLEYFINGDKINLFVITKEGFSLISLQNDSDLLQSVEAFVDLTSDPNSDVGELYKLSEKVYKKLIEPANSLLIDGQINQLTIIPDGFLNYLPFELLGDNNPENINGLLLNKYDISYAYSSVLKFRKSSRNKSSQYNSSIISFAPETFNYSLDSITDQPLATLRSELVPLSWTKKETSLLSQYFTNESFSGSTATEKNFKKNVNDYGIIHLATHAIIDNTEPMNSKLFFENQQDSLEDGILHAFELYSMEIDAELAVLSACQTGYGNLSKGEGIISLANGFAYAGVPSVVMSHWKVDDQSTSLLMDYFYKNLSNGLTKSASLRNAKLEYLENASPNKQHPFFWGAFVVYGDDSPMSNSGSTNWIYYLLGSIIILLVVALIFRRKNSVQL